jgi:hypothetical protein
MGDYEHAFDYARKALTWQKKAELIFHSAGSNTMCRLH